MSLCLFPPLSAMSPYHILPSISLPDTLTGRWSPPAPSVSTVFWSIYPSMRGAPVSYHLFLTEPLVRTGHFGFWDTLGRCESWFLSLSLFHYFFLHPNTRRYTDWTVESSRYLSRCPEPFLHTTCAVWPCFYSSALFLSLPSLLILILSFSLVTFLYTYSFYFPSLSLCVSILSLLCHNLIPSRFRKWVMKMMMRIEDGEREVINIEITPLLIGWTGTVLVLIARVYPH